MANRNPKARPSTLDSVQTWPLYVFCSEEHAADDEISHKLYFMPSGVRLSDTDYRDTWGIFDDTDRLELPRELKLGDNLVVTSVYSVIPSVARYGLPDFANEGRVATWFRRVLGCDVLEEEIEINFHDMGDDSGSRFWFEGRVHPTIAEALLQVERQAPARESDSSTPGRS
jgi:hypothetical protein